MSNDRQQSAADFFSNPLIAREIKWLDTTRTFYFRRVSGDDRVKLQTGQRWNMGAKKGEDQENTTTFDLGDLETRKQMLVQFATFTADGKKEFRNLLDVRALPGPAIDLLHREAEDVNKDLEDAGK
jgi:hypothetical protein